MSGVNVPRSVIPPTSSMYCAWCNAHMAGPKVADPASEASHGICPKCLEGFKDEFRQYHAGKGRDVSEVKFESAQNVSFKQFIARKLFEKGL